LAIGSFLTAPRVQSLNASRTVALAMAVFAIGNLACYFAKGATALFVLRAMVGFFAGAVQAIVIAVGATTLNPHRTFSVIYTGLAVIVTLLFLGMPLLVSTLGPKATLLPLPALGVVGLLCSFRVRRPVGRQTADEPESRASGPLLRNPACLILIAAWILFQLAQNGLWTYAERIANGIHISFATINYIAAQTSLSSIVTTLFAGWLGRRVGLALPLVALVSLSAGAIYMFSIMHSSAQYAVANFGLWVALFMSYPYFATLAAAIDSTGRLAGLLPATQALGLAAGPALAGLVIGAGKDYAFLAELMSLLTLASVVIVFPALQIDRRTAKKVPIGIERPI
jgi:predicted MFS family arabinose efflux permease